jgi:hypothetical protein
MSCTTGRLSIFSMFASHCPALRNLLAAEGFFVRQGKEGVVASEPSSNFDGFEARQRLGAVSTTPHMTQVAPEDDSRGILLRLKGYFQGLVANYRISGVPEDCSRSTLPDMPSPRRNPAHVAIICRRRSSMSLR